MLIELATTIYCVVLMLGWMTSSSEEFSRRGSPASLKGDKPNDGQST